MIRNGRGIVLGIGRREGSDMARNSTYSKKIEQYFREHPGKVIGVTELVKAAQCSPTSVSAAISYLRKKRREGKGGLDIVTLTRGKEWMLSLSTKKPRLTVSEDAAKISANIGAMKAPDWAEAEQRFSAKDMAIVVVFEPIGQSTDGFMLVKNESGNVFKVVPV